jgi:hypothetical protein
VKTVNDNRSASESDDINLPRCPTNTDTLCATNTHGVQRHNAAATHIGVTMNDLDANDSSRHFRASSRSRWTVRMARNVAVTSSVRTCAPSHQRRVERSQRRTQRRSTDTRTSQSRKPDARTHTRTEKNSAMVSAVTSSTSHASSARANSDGDDPLHGSSDSDTKGMRHTCAKVGEMRADAGNKHLVANDLVRAPQTDVHVHLDNVAAAATQRQLHTHRA